MKLIAPRTDYFGTIAHGPHTFRFAHGVANTTPVDGDTLAWLLAHGIRLAD